MSSDQLKQSVAEANANHLAYGDNPTMHWQHIDLHVKCHPQYEALALDWIRRLLGYLPEQHAYMPSMAMLQAAIQNFKSGAMTDNDFLKDLIFLGRKIRSQDMRSGGWVENKAYLESDFYRYRTHLSIYKQAARNRLCAFMQYEPLLEHSLGAEIFLRQLFENDNFYTEMAYGEIDYKAATIVKYREAFLTQGERAATNADLIYFDNTTVERQ